MSFVAAAVAATLMALALVHLYWAAGGRWGADAAVPEVAGKRAFEPGPAACIVVAGLLSAAAALVVLRAARWSPSWLPAWLPAVGCAGVALVFALRAIGDFKLVGFFKRVRETRFARRDTRLFSPLCLALAAGCALVALGVGVPPPARPQPAVSPRTYDK